MRPLLTLLCAALLATPALAGDSHGMVRDAKVTKVKPIYRTVAVEVPHQNCYRERVSHRGDDRSYTAPLLGAVIGGAIGNELGHHKSSQRVGAVVGAALGASIANDISHHPGRGNRHNRTVERCYDEPKVDYRQEVVGYRVTYRYHGETFTTRLPYDPGRRLKVRVNVEPLS